MKQQSCWGGSMVLQEATSEPAGKAKKHDSMTSDASEQTPGQIGLQISVP
jgi:hypothetical protein